MWCVCVGCLDWFDYGRCNLGFGLCIGFGWVLFVGCYLWLRLLCVVGCAGVVVVSVVILVLCLGCLFVVLVGVYLVRRLVWCLWLPC